MTRALLITADDLLRDELHRLAAAAGTELDTSTDPASAMRTWSSMPLVLLGADLAGELGRLQPARRPGVQVVCWGAAGEETFRAAVHVGAESVAELPEASVWLGDLLADVGDSVPARGLTIGVLGGAGGAGATTFASALGQCAGRAGPTVVIDADPLGPGVDRVLGVEEAAGVRWGDLAETTGRLGGRSLRDALPRRHDLRVLAWGAAEERKLPATVAREVLAAARRGHDTVVLDLPRAGDVVTADLRGRCDLVVIVVPPTITGVASSARIAAELPDAERLRLLVRGRGADPAQIARAVGVPAVTSMTDQRGLRESIDLGLGPMRATRGPLARAAAEVLAHASLRGAGLQHETRSEAA
ncbi:septum site-determining protein Ssd [Nocardioides insulae]|uniref:septum site-determining protein Ssd n=1 Tax=Nocardioides insulae TaxID=394734 RepID=UPI00041A8D77|nr:septum site-determining protein Ssd [Nocardioides insulae]